MTRTYIINNKVILTTNQLVIEFKEIDDNCWVVLDREDAKNLLNKARKLKMQIKTHKNN